MCWNRMLSGSSRVAKRICPWRWETRRDNEFEDKHSLFIDVFHEVSGPLPSRFVPSPSLLLSMGCAVGTSSGATVATATRPNEFITFRDKQPRTLPHLIFSRYRICRFSTCHSIHFFTVFFPPHLLQSTHPLQPEDFMTVYSSGHLNSVILDQGIFRILWGLVPVPYIYTNKKAKWSSRRIQYFPARVC